MEILQKLVVEMSPVFVLRRATKKITQDGRDGAMWHFYDNFTDNLTGNVCKLYDNVTFTVLGLTSMVPSGKTVAMSLFSRSTSSSYDSAFGASPFSTLLWYSPAKSIMSSSSFFCGVGWDGVEGRNGLLG